MRKVTAAILLIATLFIFASCGEDRDAHRMLSDFAKAYGVGGVIYSPSLGEWEQGRITEQLYRKIYMTGQTMPENFAILLNSGVDSFCECAVFVCGDSAQMAEIHELCLGRLKLLDPTGERCLVIKDKNVLFYSTLTDPARARSAWKRISD